MVSAGARRRVFVIGGAGWWLFVFCVLFLGMGIVVAGQGEVGFLVKGGYTMKLLNPSTGKVHEDTITTNTFWVWRLGDRFKVCVTNTQFGYVQYAWAVYDGTKYVWIQCRPSDKEHPVRAEIYPKPYINTSWGWTLSLEYLWLMYCFPPEILMKSGGSVDSGRYFGNRISPARCGWRLEGAALPGGVFFEWLRRVRDTSLDLDDLGELRREELDCPETIEDWNGFYDGLNSRRRIPNGFVSREYRCLEWVRTNGVGVPIRGLFRVWIYPVVPHNTYTSHYEEVEICATSVEPFSSEEVFVETGFEVPSKEFKTYVRDYRYRRFRDDRIFNCASYVLKPGEPFRSANDPELLAQAERALRRGRRYYEPPVSGKHKVLWAVAVLLAIPPVVYLLYRWRSAKNAARG